MAGREGRSVARRITGVERSRRYRRGIAEEEGHHPDFSVHWNRVDFTIWTHAIGGLSRNDFILAAKIDVVGRR